MTTRTTRRRPRRPPVDKPPYRVPTMEEIRQLPWNGFNAVSTFSGAGGSSLGYRMAGFRVLWASEFIPAAQSTYLANAAPTTIVDGRDIRDVTGRHLLDATGLRVGEIDLFDGSPPCSAFSSAGKKDAHWGQVKTYSDTTQRVDDLFFEYARLIDETKPRVFVAENVQGLVTGTARGYFKNILAALQGCGYRVSARLLNARNLGVPQHRPRIIIVGVRQDLNMEPAHPQPLPYEYAIRDAVDVAGSFTHDPETGEDLRLDRYAIGKLWYETPIGGAHPKRFSLKRPHPDGPFNTICASGARPGLSTTCHWGEPRHLTLGELRPLAGFPDDFVLTGSYEQRWERIGRAVPPVMMAHIAAAIRDKILAPLREKGTL